MYPVRLRRHAAGLLVLSLLAVLVPAFDATSAQESYDRPIKITRGGTYQGSWSSDDAKTPAVIIATSQPVIIENSFLRGRGDLILGTVSHVDLTVRNTSGQALNPNVRGREPGRFIALDGGFDNAVIENNLLESTSGIFLLEYEGNRSPEQTVRVVGNQARNIDGRHSNGKDGWLTGIEDNELVQFVQLDKVRNVPHMEIAWNEVINEPFVSRAEDLINLYRSGGTPESPARIHDNFLRGAYPALPGSQPFSGGGIMLGDEASGSWSAGDVEVYGNSVVGTTNYGISVVCGHDHRVYDNRIISSGTLADGSWISAQNVGLSMGSSANWGGRCAEYRDNVAFDNVVNWHGRGWTNNFWIPDCTSCLNNSSLTGTMTVADEDAEHALWLDRVAAEGPVVGLVEIVEPPTTTTTSTVPESTTTTTSTVPEPTTTTTVLETTPPMTTPPTTEAPVDPGDPIGTVTFRTTSSGVTVSGWTFDPDAPTKVIEGSIEVDGRVVGIGDAGDVAKELTALHPEAGTRHGYQIPVTLSRGTHEVCVFGHNAPRTAGSNAKLGCSTFTQR